MVPSQEKVDALRQATAAMEDALEKAKAADAANAVAAAVAAKVANDAHNVQVEANAANESAQLALAKASADTSAPATTNPQNLDFDHGNGGNGGYGHGGDDGYGHGGGSGASNGQTPTCNGLTGIQIAIWGLAMVLVLLFILGWLGWLTGSKASADQVNVVNTRVDQLHVAVASVNATAIEAKKDAASAVSVANTANGKSDTTSSKADEAMRKAQAALDAKHVHTHKRHKPMITERRQDNPPKIPTKGEPDVSQGQDAVPAYWYWRENTATVEKPGKCIFSGGDGTGKPPFCASFTISPPKEGEKKATWIGRVGNGRVVLDQATWQKKD